MNESNGSIKSLYEAVMGQSAAIADLSATAREQEKRNQERHSTLANKIDGLDEKVDELSITIASMPDDRRRDIQKAIEKFREQQEKKSEATRGRVAVLIAAIVGIAGIICALLPYFMS